MATQFWVGVRKYKNVPRESTFGKVAMYALYCVAMPISNADGTNFLNCNFNKNNV